MPEIICIDCGVKLKPERNGVPVVDMFNQPPVPYRVRYSDSWKCPGCGLTVLAGFGEPEAEHFHPNFGEVLGRVLKDFGLVRVFERVGDKQKFMLKEGKNG